MKVNKIIRDDNGRLYCPSCHAYHNFSIRKEGEICQYCEEVGA